ncbi:MAG: response regulator [Acidimicrobiales bacterium]
MVVDDHSLVADAIEAVVGTYPGLHVAGTARDVADAWDLVERFEPDVVLMDVDLPSGDGITCAIAIKAAHPGTKILVVSGQGTDDVINRTITGGLDGYVSKSTGITAMIDAIRRVAAGEAVFTTTDLTRVVRGLGTSRSPAELSRREVEVLQCLVDGQSTAEIAATLFVSVHTVRSHVRHILEKLDAHSKLEAVAIALRSGIVEVRR